MADSNHLPREDIGQLLVDFNTKMSELDRIILQRQEKVGPLSVLCD